MPGRRSHTALEIVSNLYQALLIVYPAEHRREYGSLMAQTFGDMCREMHRRKGMPGLILLSIHTLGDAAVTAIVEHIDRLKNGARNMTKKQHLITLVLAGFPLVLGLALFTINPHFMGRMFMPGYENTQPQGMLMTAAVVVLAVAAYLTQRWSLTRSNRVMSEGGKGKAAVPRVLFVGSFILFVLPAVLLVVFGPAALLLMEAGAIG